MSWKFVVLILGFCVLLIIKIFVLGWIDIENQKISLERNIVLDEVCPDGGSFNQGSITCK